VAAQIEKAAKGVKSAANELAGNAAAGSVRRGF